MDRPGRRDDIKLIHASLPRTGTMSIAQAYKMLGLNAHHVHMQPSTLDCDWEAFDRAVDGKWPEAPGAKPGRPLFTREDWDDLHGEWDVYTDFLCHFSPDHMRAYPEAKVVIVQRDFDSWWPSYKEICLDLIELPVFKVMSLLLRLSKGYSLMDACRRQYCGAFMVKTINEIDEATARAFYDGFYEEVRSLAAPERCLEYRIGDGWEPLCEFLDVPVPDEPFPRLNSREELNARQVKRLQRRSEIVVGGLFGILAVCIGIWTYRSL